MRQAPEIPESSIDTSANSVDKASREKRNVVAQFIAPNQQGDRKDRPYIR